MPLPPPQSVRRILVRSVNWLGDAVMTTPALLRLRERFPEARIHLLTPQKLALLWEGFSAVDAVMSFGPEEGLLSIARRVRAERFDIGIAFPNSTRTAIELWAGGVKHRVGYGGRARMFWLNHRVSRPATQRGMPKRSLSEIRRRIAHPSLAETLPPEAHHLHHYLHLVGAVGGSTLPLSPRLAVNETETRAFRERFLSTFSGHSGPVLGLNAGAEYGPAKRWPEERFAAAAVELAGRTGAAWILFGGAADRSLTERVERRMREAGAQVPIANVAGSTSLRELMAGLKLCGALLTNDSGPMHVAAALGTSVVVPFGSTSPELTAPGLPGDPQHHLLRVPTPCTPCFQRECPIDFRCMQGVRVEQAVEALIKALGRRDPSAQTLRTS